MAQNMRKLAECVVCLLILQSELLTLFSAQVNGLSYSTDMGQSVDVLVVDMNLQPCWIPGCLDTLTKHKSLQFPQMVGKKA